MAASALHRDYSAVLETQTLEYYRARRRVFQSEAWFDECAEMASRWASSLVSQTFDRRTDYDYVSAFEELSGQLWADLAIDCGPLFGAGRAVLAAELGVMLAQRLDEARSTMGATRFDELSKLALVTASDELWPDLLSHLRDVALTNAIYGPTHRFAVAHFTRQAHAAYKDFVSSARSTAVPRLLTLHFQERLLSGPDTVIPVKEEILSILA
jgi:preprotein translocase subunit SecA